MNKFKILIILIGFIVVLSVVYFVSQNTFIGRSDIVDLTNDQKSSTGQIYDKSTPPEIATSTIGTVASSTLQNFDRGQYSYLFEANRELNTTNIVGYFAHGAFAWYVPDWLVNNWEMKPFRSEGMIFSPKVRVTPAAGQQYDFSDIEFDVSTSTELINAYALYLTLLNDIPKDEIIISEVLLNKSATDMISIQMENSTRIYHITAYTRDFERITDIYFMDGNGKTLDLRFEAKASIFSQFSDKIRDMVEGVGELKSPQG